MRPRQGKLSFKTEPLKKWLELNDWNHQRFAEALGVTREYVSMLLAGRRLPSFETIQAICEVTGLEVGRFIEYQREPVLATESKES